MGWSTREVAQLAGTTLRTVRHYHEIGLLDEPERKCPTATSPTARSTWSGSWRSAACLASDCRCPPSRPRSRSPADLDSILDAVQADLAATIGQLQRAQKEDCRAASHSGQDRPAVSGLRSLPAGPTSPPRIGRCTPSSRRSQGDQGLAHWSSMLQGVRRTPRVRRVRLAAGRCRRTDPAAPCRADAPGGDDSARPEPAAGRRRPVKRLGAVSIRPHGDRSDDRSLQPRSARRHRANLARSRHRVTDVERRCPRPPGECGVERRRDDIWRLLHEWT